MNKHDKVLYALLAIAFILSVSATAYQTFVLKNIEAYDSSELEE